MTTPIERRKAERRTEDEELSLEYLTLLEVVGAEMRASDRARLAELRKALGAEQAVAPSQPTQTAPPAGQAASQAKAPARDRRRTSAA
jgi:hypothetical protein